MGVEIRRVREDEAPTLRKLCRDAVQRLAERYPDDRYGISEQGLDHLEQHWRLGASHDEAFCLVAVREGAIVGWVDAELSRSTTLPGLAGEIGDLYRLPGHEDVGRPLVEAAVRRLQELGASPILHMDDIRRPDPVFDELGFERDVVRQSLYA